MNLHNISTDRVLQKIHWTNFMLFLSILAVNAFFIFADYVYAWGPSIGLTEESLEILSRHDLTSKETLMKVSQGDIDSLGLVTGQKIKLKEGIEKLQDKRETGSSTSK